MARFSDGWFAVTRRMFLPDLQNNEFYGKPNLLVVWLTTIAWANVWEGKTRLTHEQVVVARGDLVTSYAQLAAVTGLTTKKVRNAVDYLVKTGKLGRLEGRGGLFLRVLNYEKYQNPEEYEGRAGGTWRAGEGQAEGRGRAGEGQPIEQGDQVNKKTTKQGLFPEDVLEAPRPTKTERVAAAKVVKSAETWSAYRIAHLAAHGVEPKDNARVRSMACKLVDYLGADDAPAVAEWYVLNEKGDRGWLVSSRHPLGELVKNYNAYYTNWKRGEKVSPAMARTVAQDDANRDVINRALARKQAEQHARETST